MNDWSFSAPQGLRCRIEAQDDGVNETFTIIVMDVCLMVGERMKQHFNGIGCTSPNAPTESRMSAQSETSYSLE